MNESWSRVAIVVASICLVPLTATDAWSQVTLRPQADSQWAQLPEGRLWGAVTGVYPDPDGRHMWVLDRCGENNCLGSSLDPIFKFDLDGNLVTSFGAGLFAWPHGFYVDPEGNVWVTDGGTGARGDEAARAGMGHEVVKLSPEGEVLLRLGRPGVAGSGPDTFNGPSEVLVTDSGDIFVADGHGSGGNNRIVKFNARGQFLMEWGSGGSGPAAGEMNDAHALAMDSQGRLFVGDRGNNRIQIFSADGVFLDHWTQFGPPSSIYIDSDDVIYVTDTPTNVIPPWYAQGRNETWVRGIRIGDARTGHVTGYFESEAEFLAADDDGNVYAAEVAGQRLVRYTLQ